MDDRVFFPQAALDQWLVEGMVDLRQNELTVLTEGRRYHLVDAVRVIREVTGGPDTHALVGRVKARTMLEELGAEIVESSMLLGEAAFDVEPGWIGVPATSFAEHLVSDARQTARSGRPSEGPQSDEELLRRLLEHKP